MDDKQYVESLIDIGLTNNQILEKLKDRTGTNQQQQEAPSTYGGKVAKFASDGVSKIFNAWSSDISENYKKHGLLGGALATAQAPLKTAAGVVEAVSAPASSALMQGLSDTGLDEKYAENVAGTNFDVLGKIGAGIRAVDSMTDDQFSNLLTVAPVPSTIKYVKNLKPKLTRTTKSLHERMSGVDVDSAVDSVVTGAAEVAKNVQKIPEKIGQTVKASVDRKHIKLATEDPIAAKSKILDLYKRGIVPGVKNKKKTVGAVASIDESVKRAIPELAKKYDVENSLDFANAISSEKKAVYSLINQLVKDATDGDFTVKLDGLVSKLDELGDKEIAKFSPEMRKAIKDARDILVDDNGMVRNISPSGAEDLIVRFNSELDSFYKGRASGTGADVEIKSALVRVLREEVDKTVSQLDSISFKELKAQYSDLKAMDADVTHRAVFQAQKGQGLAGLTDIFSAGDIAAGAIDPAFLVRGISQYVTKEITQALSDKDELIRQAFIIGKNLKHEVPKVSKPK